jgi:hypothetical protein
LEAAIRRIVFLIVDAFSMNVANSSRDSPNSTAKIEAYIIDNGT